MSFNNFGYSYPPLTSNSLLRALFNNHNAQQAVRRRAFFPFHFDDVMRVNNVRLAWRAHRRAASPVPTFTDSSLWESKKLHAPESIKSLIRDGVQGTSAVCVLVGSSTWDRRWVRYEIARSVVDKKGLLVVHLNGINHHQSRSPDPYGLNPLDYMAVGKDLHGRYHLFEKECGWNADLARYEWGWHRYKDYQLPVDLPWYLPDPRPGYVTPLSRGTLSYCYIGDKGYQNIGLWIDAAARAVGR